MALSVDTAPAVEPVTRAQAKRFLRVDLDEDDSLIDSLISAARQQAEELTNRTFVNTTYTLTLDGFPGANARPNHLDADLNIRLPRPPAVSVSSITYLTASDGTVATATTSVYGVDVESEPGRVYLKYNQTWPTARDIENAVTITYVGGYGSAATDVPDRAVTLTKMLLADMYEHREARLDVIVRDNPTVTRLAAGLLVPEMR